MLMVTTYNIIFYLDLYKKLEIIRPLPPTNSIMTIHFTNYKLYKSLCDHTSKEQNIYCSTFNNVEKEYNKKEQEKLILTTVSVVANNCNWST